MDLIKENEELKKDNQAWEEFHSQLMEYREQLETETIELNKKNEILLKHNIHLKDVNSIEVIEKERTENYNKAIEYLESSKYFCDITELNEFETIDDIDYKTALKIASGLIEQ